jgi:hypothetical protein
LEDKHVENKTDIATNTASIVWLQKLMMPLIAAVVGMFVTLVPVLTLWIADKLKVVPPPLVPVVQPSPNVSVTVHPPEVVPPVVQPPAAQPFKLTLYLTSADDVATAQEDTTLKKLGVVVDTKAYQAGSTFKGVLLPCAAMSENKVNGNVIGVVAYTTPEALAAWVKGK